MKRTYIKPRTDIIEIGIQSMVAASPTSDLNGFGGYGGDADGASEGSPTSADSKQNGWNLE